MDQLTLIENIDSYIKLNECGNTVGFHLSSSVDSIDSTISVDNTDGFPQNYGLIRINDEIITYILESRPIVLQDVFVVLVELLHLETLMTRKI